MTLSEHIHCYEGEHGNWVCECGDRQEHVAYFQTMSAYHANKRLEASKQRLNGMLTDSWSQALLDGLRMALNACQDTRSLKRARFAIADMIEAVEKRMRGGIR